ncbi:hypothetical protein B0T24DRAFT_711440 [Lasiosphaeria ovina]|uniref:Uncharacterized protein n=1 Tax=Lasiosphaeria ovina TaxID=92902 RepID=A0AAE0JXD2_9PEZI|nr:hypothetical protein B0T24DRAFT_711440 [Lasiosphaeria ovina]
MAREDGENRACARLLDVPGHWPERFTGPDQQHMQQFRATLDINNYDGPFPRTLPGPKDSWRWESNSSSASSSSSEDEAERARQARLVAKIIMASCRVLSHRRQYYYQDRPGSSRYREPTRDAIYRNNKKRRRGNDITSNPLSQFLPLNVSKTGPDQSETVPLSSAAKATAGMARAANLVAPRSSYAHDQEDQQDEGDSGSIRGRRQLSSRFALALIPLFGRRRGTLVSEDEKDHHDHQSQEREEKSTKKKGIKHRLFALKFKMCKGSHSETGGSSGENEQNTEGAGVALETIGLGPEVSKKPGNECEGISFDGGAVEIEAMVEALIHGNLASECEVPSDEDGKKGQRLDRPENGVDGRCWEKMQRQEDHDGDRREGEGESMVIDAPSWFADIDGTGSKDKGKEVIGPLVVVRAPAEEDLRLVGLEERWTQAPSSCSATARHPSGGVPGEHAPKEQNETADGSQVNPRVQTCKASVWASGGGALCPQQITVGIECLDDALPLAPGLALKETSKQRPRLGAFLSRSSNNNNGSKKKSDENPAGQPGQKRMSSGLRWVFGSFRGTAGGENKRRTSETHEEDKQDHAEGTRVSRDKSPPSFQRNETAA